MLAPGLVHLQAHGIAGPRQIAAARNDHGTQTHAGRWPVTNVSNPMIGIAARYQ